MKLLKMFRHGGGLSRRVTGIITERLTPTGAPVSDRRAVFVGAFVLFAFMTVFAWIRLPESDTEIRWWLLALLVVVGTPANLSATSYEFRVMGRLLGIAIPFHAAARVSVLSSAANLLPLPGSVLVRAMVLRERGATYKEIGLAVSAMAVGLLAMTGVICGSVLLVSHHFILGGALETAGAIAVVVLLAIARGIDSEQLSIKAFNVLLAETLLIGVVGIRLFLVLPALGYGESVAQTAALAAASVAATATGVFPAGLGIRELASGVAGNLVSLPVEVGVIAAAVDRIAFGVGLLPILAGLIWKRHTRPGRNHRSAA